MESTAHAAVMDGHRFAPFRQSPIPCMPVWCVGRAATKQLGPMKCLKSHMGVSKGEENLLILCQVGFVLPGSESTLGVSLPFSIIHI